VRQDLRALIETAWARTALFVGTGAGIGFAPIVPGSFGSLWGPLVVWWLRSPALPGLLYAAAALLLVVVGVPICTTGARVLRRHDPAPVVIDEIAAFPIVFAVVELDLATAILGFLSFRVFDITKPWPVRRFERLPRGFGIMADDLVAAVYAGGALWLIVRILGLSA
jgi:phosphatidylglycerophosphatase A